MRTLLLWISRLKWLGLLGLPMFFSEQPIWKLFWLFWLFGILEIGITFPVLIASLRQMIGMAIVNKKNKPMPDKDNFTPKIKYSLPFHGGWVAVNGGVTKESSHSWEISSQRYAYDFIILDNDGKSFSGDEAMLSDYHCYGKEILAPADGVVVEIRINCNDSKIMGNGGTDPLFKDLRGNYIVIRHTDDEYSCLAHLKPGSIEVRVGQHVKRKQRIALCGNSGNTSEPHLHFQIQNGRSFFSSAGLPIHTENIQATPQIGYSSYDPRPIPIPNEGFISRGQCVRNI